MDELIARLRKNVNDEYLSYCHVLEAADALERQAAEIERLRATLGYYSYADDGGKRARAALTGEDT